MWSSEFWRSHQDGFASRALSTEVGRMQAILDRSQVVTFPSKGARICDLARSN